MRDYYKDKFLEVNRTFSYCFNNKKLEEDFYKSAESFYNIYKTQDVSNLGVVSVNVGGNKKRQTLSLFFAYDLLKFCSNENGIFFAITFSKVHRFWNNLSRNSGLSSYFFESLGSYPEVISFRKRATSKMIEEALVFPGNKSVEEIFESNYYNRIKFTGKLSNFILPTVVQYFFERLGIEKSLMILGELVDRYSDLSGVEKLSYFTVTQSNFTLKDVLTFVDEASQSNSIEDFPIEWLLKAELGV